MGRKKPLQTTLTVKPDCWTEEQWQEYLRAAAGYDPMYHRNRMAEQGDRNRRMAVRVLGWRKRSGMQ